MTLFDVLGGGPTTQKQVPLVAKASLTIAGAIRVVDREGMNNCNLLLTLIIKSVI
jgi:hypothetical protein